MQRLHRLAYDIRAGVHRKRFQAVVVDVEGGPADPRATHQGGDADLRQGVFGALVEEGLAQPCPGAGGPPVLGLGAAHRAIRRAARATAPGSAWAKRMRRFAVTAP